MTEARRRSSSKRAFREAASGGGAIGGCPRACFVNRVACETIHAGEPGFFGLGAIRTKRWAGGREPNRREARRPRPPRAFSALSRSGPGAPNPVRMNRKTDLSERRPGPYIRLTRQQPKGGDPVSHCLTPRSSARVAWVLAFAEVRAA